MMNGQLTPKRQTNTPNYKLPTVSKEIIRCHLLGIYLKDTLSIRYFSRSAVNGRVSVQLQNFGASITFVTYVVQGSWFQTQMGHDALVFKPFKFSDSMVTLSYN